MKKYLLAGALAAAASVPAQAAVSITYQGGVSPTPAGLTIVEDFESYAPGFSIGTNARVFSGSEEGVAARPAFNSTGNFGAILGEPVDGTATYTFARAVGIFSFVLGSLDTYNTLTLNFIDGTSQVLAGGAIKNDPVFDSGNQTIPDTNGRVTYNVNGGPRIASVTFQSTQNSFEFDNFAVGSIPEPATWAMMVLGFGVLGSALRGRRRRQGIAHTFA